MINSCNCNNKCFRSLVDSVYEGIKENAEFFALKINIEGYINDEIIINTISDLREHKLEYIASVYSNNLELRNNSKIRIVDFDFGNSFEELETRLIK